MKAAPHPDKGGAPAPVALLTPGPRPSISSLSRLHDLRLQLELRSANAWDSWEEATLAACLVVIRQKIEDAERDLRCQLEPDIWGPGGIAAADYVIVEPPTPS